MITLVKPILFAFINSTAVKKLIADLLSKLAEQTDNDVMTLPSMPCALH